MYCYIKYIDYKDIQPSEFICTAIENKQLLFNPDCYIRIILDYVYGEVGIPNEIQNKFDFATEKGKVLKINDYPPNVIGLEIFTDKETYYIVYWDDDNQIKPMLGGASREITEFEAYQRRRSSQSKRRSSANKSSQGSSLVSNETKLRMSQSKN
ncbi:unnamed protein product [Phaedon cochleariae]|uniref:Uncharacterized protein n=1 Tax=Phaedon cochleariae TaxID=80249 RepID=A0A9N9SHL8_PHACE|nr:unnamed protein product [Phaedon cochleariae]